MIPGSQTEPKRGFFSRLVRRLHTTGPETTIIGMAPAHPQAISVQGQQNLGKPLGGPSGDIWQAFSLPGTPQNHPSTSDGATSAAPSGRPRVSVGIDLRDAGYGELPSDHGFVESLNVAFPEERHEHATIAQMGDGEGHHSSGTGALDGVWNLKDGHLQLPKRYSQLRIRNLTITDTHGCAEHLEVQLGRCLWRGRAVVLSKCGMRLVIVDANGVPVTYSRA